MFVPLGLLLVLVAAWCGYWLFISQTSQSHFSAWVEEAKSDGMTVQCGTQNWGGFPFRVEIDCAPLDLAWSNNAGTGAIGLARLESVFQAYNPQHILAAVSSPVSYRIGSRGGAMPNSVITATFDPATVSLMMSGGEFDRASLVVEKLIADIGGEEGVGAQGRARRLELHTRFVQPDATSPPVLEIAGDAEDISLAGPAITDATGIPIELDVWSLRAQANGSFVPTTDPSTALKAFALGGGEVNITRLHGQRGDVTLEATGRLTFDEKGRANGELQSDVVNLKAIFKQLQEAGRLGEMEAAFSFNMLSLLEGATSGREGALRVKIAVAKGKIYFGPFEIAKLPPLF